MSRALVLNASYEPLCVVADRRAVVLVLNEKADLLSDAGWVLHAEKVAIPVPSVVRLRYFVRVPFDRGVALSRRAVFARDDHLCQYCGVGAESIDHVVPRSRGGGHAWDNVVAACRPCNLRKGDRFLHETNLVLRRRPVAPRRLAWVRVTVPEVPVDWEPYLQAA